MSSLTTDEVVAEIVWTAKVIREVIGVVPTMIRPPCKFYRRILIFRWRFGYENKGDNICSRVEDCTVE